MAKGQCGGGCGDMGALEEVIGQVLGMGETRQRCMRLGGCMAFCYIDKVSKWFNYLVIHKKIPCEGCDGHYYDSEQVSGRDATLHRGGTLLAIAYSSHYAQLWYTLRVDYLYNPFVSAKGYICT